MEDRYERLKLIGAGTFGQVWLVRQYGTSKNYVVKEVRTDGLKEKELAQVMTEVETLDRCRHSNVIRYREACVDRPAGRLCIVMEYAVNGLLI